MLTREQFEETVKERVRLALELKEMEPALSAMKNERNRIVAETERKTVTAALLKKSGDVNLPNAEADAAVAQAEAKRVLPDLEKDIEALRKEVAAAREAIKAADVEIETTREVMAVFGKAD